MTAILLSISFWWNRTCDLVFRSSFLSGYTYQIDQPWKNRVFFYIKNKFCYIVQIFRCRRIAFYIF